MVSTTRPIICLTLCSRSGEDMRPRKYFCETMFVAVCDQNFGNSTPFCSKTAPSLPGIRASRDSHSISSKGSRPGIVKRRRTPTFASSCATAFTSCSSVISTVSTAFVDAISRDLRLSEWYVLRHGSRGTARVERTAQNRGGIGRNLWAGSASGTPPETGRNHRVEPDEHHALIPRALPVVDDECGQPGAEEQRDREQRREDKRQRGREEQAREDEGRRQGERHLQRRVHDHGDREVGSVAGRELDADHVLDGVPGDRHHDQPREGLAHVQDLDRRLKSADEPVADQRGCGCGRAENDERRDERPA